MHAGTIAVFSFSAVLFFIVRQLLIRWGLVEPGSNSTDKGDYGLGRLFAWLAYFFLWVSPSWIAWLILRCLQHFGVVQ